jgi:hypothetical protein
MDGSIKWAPCVEDSNKRVMPLVKDWGEEWNERHQLGWEENSGDFFYNWHLCHEVDCLSEKDDRTTEDDATDDSETDYGETDEENIDNQVDEGDSDDE